MSESLPHTDAYLEAVTLAFNNQASTAVNCISMYLGKIQREGVEAGEAAERVAAMTAHLRKAYALWEEGEHRDALRELRWAIEKGTSYGSDG